MILGFALVVLIGSGVVIYAAKTPAMMTATTAENSQPMASTFGVWCKSVIEMSHATASALKSPSYRIYCNRVVDQTS
jgi:hypothetical protein